MSKDELFKQVEDMDNVALCEMMESKVVMKFSISELINLHTAIGTYLETLEGTIMDIMSDEKLTKLQERLYSKITIRLGTYGIFVDDLEEE